MQKIKCDRCTADLSTLKTDYYDMRNKEWSRYSHKHEKFVCEMCLFCDPRYIEDHGEQLCKTVTKS